MNKSKILKKIVSYIMLVSYCLGLFFFIYNGMNKNEITAIFLMTVIVGDYFFN